MDSPLTDTNLSAHPIDLHWQRPLAEHPEAPVFEANVQRADFAEEPLYRDMCRLVARSPRWLALMDLAPPSRRFATLLLAGVHVQILAAHDRGEPRQALADYFASVAGTRSPDAALADAMDGFLEAHEATLRRVMASRCTQTNEIGRCTVLRPALAEIARLKGGRPLALFDFGTSAGLNLGVDRYHVDYLMPRGETFSADTGLAGAPTLACRVLGTPPPLGHLGHGAWRLTARAGVDLAPIDVNDDEAVRWLRACVWPSDRARAARLQSAIALARPARDPVHVADDGLAVLEAWLSILPEGVVPVLFNSWVLSYLTRDELVAHRDRVLRLVSERGLWWVSAEDDQRCGVTTGLQPPATPVEGEVRSAQVSHTFWTLTRPSADGPVHQFLARSHPHGAWMEWLAGG